ncbi:MAG TPA: response regulator [Gemmatimonadales bacterium]|nr:response regulator [Gemmatimonadales bacterium]
MRREGAPVRALVVDDDDATRALLRAVLVAAGHPAPTVVASAREALAAAPGHEVILLDHQLPDGAGLDLIQPLRSGPGHPAVILVTGHGDESLAAAALRQGADDYLVKDGSLPGLVPQVVERVRRHRALREALAAAERDLVHAERMAAIGQLGITLHHEINNPLQAATAEVELLLADAASLTGEQQASLRTIREALARIHATLQRIGTLRHDRTVEYLDGVAMIDLSHRTQPLPVQQGEALLHLPDDDTARVVSLLLRHAGFTVVRVGSVAELASRAAQPGVTLVVVAGSPVPGAEPLGGFQPAPDRAYTVVALTFGDGTPARAAGADHVVTLPFDPGTFTQELLAAMRG